MSQYNVLRNSLLKNVSKPVDRKTFSNPQEPEPKSQIRDVVLSVDSDGKTLAAVEGKRPKTRNELNKEAAKLFERVDNITRRGGRTKKRRTRKRKTRKRKRRRTKKRRKSRRRKRRRTRK